MFGNASERSRLYVQDTDELPTRGRSTATRKERIQPCCADGTPPRLWRDRATDVRDRGSPAGPDAAGFDLWRLWVSHLSLGSDGWINVVNLVLYGLLLCCFAIGLRRTVRSGTGSRWGPRLIALYGIVLIAAGLFVPDPSLGYPPGMQVGAPTWHGRLHDIAGPLAFASSTAACLVLARRFRAESGGTDWLRYSVATGVTIAVSFVVCSVLVTLDFAGVFPNAPSGLFERIALFAGCLWVTLLARQSLRVHRGDG